MSAMLTATTLSGKRKSRTYLRLCGLTVMICSSWIVCKTPFCVSNSLHVSPITCRLSPHPPVEAGLHIPWESNGAFVLVPDTALLQKLLDALAACNVAWQAACADGVPKPRTGPADPFPVAQLLRQNMTWRLITLRPATLLLHNRPLTLLSFEARQKIVEQPTTYVPPRTEWHSWYLHPYLPVLVPEDSEDIADELRLPDHPHRPPNERVSLFAMLLNAHTKLQHYMRSPEVGTAYLAYRRKSGMANATPDYLIKLYAMLIGLIVDELLFKPDICDWPLKGIRRSTRPGGDGPPGGGPGGGGDGSSGGGYDEGDPHDGHDEDTGGASDKHRQAADDDSRVRRSRRATQSEEALVPCSPVDSAPPSGVLSSLTSGLAKCHIASPPFSGVDDSEARYGDWLLVEADNTLVEDAGSGKPSTAYIVQDTEQRAKSPFDSPDDPATPPEEEIDGFTETEWVVLKAQLNGRDRALAQSAAIMMICKTDYQEPVGFC
ncbi:hypothetical protein OH76DRAFT_1560208 [Lentinus brumalis]|uniref:Uncharacterized protein n=1 Tax=Lentinus brumalis TaxID=2498619 RepID=A0A371CTT3_9APHY|nr:hypothetical protein OH76DRAFT_1560208 [Polyporus brumalis]